MDESTVAKRHLIVDSSVAINRFKLKLLYLKNLAIIGIVLTFCMAGAIAISYYILNKNSLQLDEAQSLWQASHSLGGVLHVVALDVHVPMYHLLLHFWLLYIGTSINSARVMSLIFFLISIPLFYALARQILVRNWALFAVMLYSFSPFMNWYANVARMYTLLALFTVLSQLIFIKLIKRQKAWFAYGISSIFGAYSHYFFSFNLFAEGLFFLFNRKKFAPGSFKKFVLVTLSVIAAMAPWLFYFYKLGLAANTRPILQRPTTVDFFNVYSQFLFGFQDNRINTILVSSWPIIMLIGFLAVRRNQRLTPEVSFIASMAFVPVVMAFVLSFIVTPFFLSRYLISAVPPLIIFLVWLISYYGQRLARAVGLLLVIALIAASYQQDYSPATPVQENYSQAVSYINQHITSQDAVVVSSPFTIYPFEYYYHGSAPVSTLPIWNRRAIGSIPSFNPKTFPLQAQLSTNNHQYVFLLLSYNQGYENKIKSYFLNHYQRIYSHTYSNDLTLYEFKTQYYTVPPLGSKQTIITKS